MSKRLANEFGRSRLEIVSGDIQYVPSSCSRFVEDAIVDIG